MKPAHILLQRTLPGDRERQEQCVQTRIIKSLSDVASRRQDHPRFAFRYRFQSLGRQATLFLPHAALQDKYVLSNTCELCLEILEMLRPAGQEQRTASRLDRVDDVIGDHLIPLGMSNERGVDVLDRSLSKLWRHPEFCVAGRHLVLERRRLGHCPGAHAEPHRATLHVDYRMMSVLPCRRGGQTNNIFGFYLPHHLFKT